MPETPSLDNKIGRGGANRAKTEVVSRSDTHVNHCGLSSVDMDVNVTLEMI